MWTGVPHLAVRQLAFDPHLDELLLEQHPDAASEFRDRVNAPLARSRRLSGRSFALGLGLGLWCGFLEGQIEQAHR
jgi:hypothetical protein